MQFSDLHIHTKAQLLLPDVHSFPRPFCKSISSSRLPFLRLSSRRCGRIRCINDAATQEKQIKETQESKKIYPFDEVESRWQKFWEENKTFRTPEEVDTSKPKFYILDMFPYPRFISLLFSLSLSILLIPCCLRLTFALKSNFLIFCYWIIPVSHKLFLLKQKLEKKKNLKDEHKCRNLSSKFWTCFHIPGYISFVFLQ